MAFGRLERPAVQQPMSEINMTPLIDVMLVLLVIFMLTAPLMTSSLKLDLPKVKGTTAQPPLTPPLKLSLSAEGELRQDDEPITLAELERRLQPLKGSKTDVQLRADQAVAYGRVAEVLGLLRQAELTRIAFMATPPDAQSRLLGRPVAPPAGNAVGR